MTEPDQQVEVSPEVLARLLRDVDMLRGAINKALALHVEPWDGPRKKCGCDVCKVLRSAV